MALWGVTTPFDRIGARGRAADVGVDRLPPGQYVPRGWPVLHYGRVPAFDEAAWDFTVWGATADGQTRSWDWAGFGELPRSEVEADFHCVTKFSVFDNTWTGRLTSVLLELAAARAVRTTSWSGRSTATAPTSGSRTSPHRRRCS
jgi:DMSO/TMAO reductase YedYZ molybdopterin-dependent catalytic subunit